MEGLDSLNGAVNGYSRIYLLHIERRKCSCLLDFNLNKKITTLVVILYMYFVLWKGQRRHTSTSLYYTLESTGIPARHETVRRLGGGGVA